LKKLLKWFMWLFETPELRENLKFEREIKNHQKWDVEVKKMEKHFKQMEREIERAQKGLL